MGNHGKNTMDAGGARGTRASRAEDAGAERGRRRRERGRRARRGPRQGAGPTHGQAEGPTGVAARRETRTAPEGGRGGDVSGTTVHGYGSAAAGAGGCSGGEEAKAPKRCAHPPQSHKGSEHKLRPRCER